MTTISAQTDRPDTITPIHKALRRNMFQTAIALAQTDFASPAEADEAARAVATCFRFLREHAEHEDRRMLPEVFRLAPELAAELQAEHPELERAAIAIESQFPRLAPLAGSARAAMGAELCRRFQAFVAQQIRHMDREEREVNAALWAHLGDAEIAAIGGRIVADIGPVRMADWGALIGPAINRPEREAMERLRAA